MAETMMTETQPAEDVSAPVRFRSIAVSEMRNYKSVSLQLPDSHIVFVGNNGAGKTNLLEAFSLFAPGRGLRRASYDTIARIDGPGGFGIGAQLTGPFDSVQLGTGVGPVIGEQDNARRLRINGAPEKSTDVLTDYLRITWLTPSMDGLFTGPAGDRRRFLDRLVFAIEPHHGRHAIAYEKAMRQRNRLFSDGVQDNAWFEALEGEMARYGAAIALSRVRLVAALNEANALLPDGDGFPVSVLGLEGAIEDAAMRHEPETLQSVFAVMLRNNRRTDERAGRSLIGPHRSDLIVTHRAKNMPAALASTGEQKAMLTGLILGHARIIGTLCGLKAVVLLDEIGAHFDENRRAALFDILDEMGVQAIMTGTEPSLFEALGPRAAHFLVEAGTVKDISGSLGL